MQQAVICTEDGTKPAVCACFCRFPLYFLCEDHLCSHPLGEHFVHFHISLEAARLITTRERKVQCHNWFSKLHQAYTLLAEQDGEIARIEEEIAEAKIAILSEFERRFEETKRKIASFREAFQTELRKAMREIRDKALEEWVPEEGSLSALIWNYDGQHIEKMKAMDWSVKIETLSDALQLSITSPIVSLHQFTLAPKNDLDSLQRELVETRQQNAKTKEENQRIQIRFEELSERLMSLQSSVAAGILKKGSEAQQGLPPPQSIGRNTVTLLREEFAVLRLALDRAASVFIEYETKENVTFRPEEGRTLLQEGWKAMQSTPQAFKVGLKLGEMFLHLSSFTEAKATISELERIAKPAPSQEALQVATLKAVFCYLLGNYQDSAAAGVEALRSVSEGNTDEVNIAYCYTVFAYCEINVQEAERIYSKWPWALQQESIELSDIYQLSATGRLAIMQNRLQEAEDALRKVIILAPTSIFAFLNFYFLARLLAKDKPEEAKDMHENARVISISYCRGSILTSLNLIWLADLHRTSGNLEEAIAIRCEANSLLFIFHPANIAYPGNMIEIANMFCENRQLHEAIDWYNEAASIFKGFNYYPIEAPICLSRIGDIYRSAWELEEAEEMYEKADSLFAAFHPTDIRTANNLCKLADVNHAFRRAKKASVLRLKAQEIYSNHHSDDIHAA